MHNNKPGEKKYFYYFTLWCDEAFFHSILKKINNVFQLDYRVMYCGIFSVFKTINSCRDFLKVSTHT